MNRILALDVGDVRIGVAITDILQITAQPLTTIYREDEKKAIDEIEKILEDYQIKDLVVGLPINMNNTLGPQSEKVKDFVNKLNLNDIKLHYVDERLTTRSATRILISDSVRRKDRKKHVDKIAAAHILRLYLDM